VYLDAIVVKVRDNHAVRNKAAHIAVGVDTDGIKHALGIWIQQTEGAKFWAGVCAELANRGVRDILIACVDGLKGLPEAIEATWPATVVQTSSVHNGCAGMVPAVTRTIPVTTYADVQPSRSSMQTRRAGGGGGPHIGQRELRFERRDEVPGKPALRWPEPF
jgi:hypothetical protein